MDVKVTADTVTADQLENLSPEQMAALERGEEIELNANAPAAPPAEDTETGDAPDPAGEVEQQGDEGKQDVPDIDALRKQLKDEMQEEWGKERKGILADLQAERLKRQQTEQRLQELANQGKEPQQDDPLKDLSDDDFVSAADMKKYMHAQLQEKEQQFQAAIERKEHERRVYESTQKARGKYQDYDEVIQQGFSELVLSNQQLLQDVLADPDPGERAYKEGLKHPMFKDRQTDNGQQGQQKDKSTEMINKLKNRPKTISGGGSGGGGKISLEQAANMSDAEWAALPEAERRRLLG